MLFGEEQVFSTEYFTENIFSITQKNDILKSIFSTRSWLPAYASLCASISLAIPMQSVLLQCHIQYFIACLQPSRITKPYTIPTLDPGLGEKKNNKY